MKPTTIFRREHKNVLADILCRSYEKAVADNHYYNTDDPHFLTLLPNLYDSNYYPAEERKRNLENFLHVLHDRTAKHNELFVYWLQTRILFEGGGKGSLAWTDDSLLDEICFTHFDNDTLTKKLVVPVDAINNKISLYWTMEALTQEVLVKTFPATWDPIFQEGGFDGLLQNLYLAIDDACNVIRKDWVLLPQS